MLILLLKVGTLNTTGVMYKGHFDIWLINRLQVLLKATQHLIPETQLLTGWINGDLYASAGERIGILPVPDSIRAAADIQSYHHTQDFKQRHGYLAQQQNTKYAVVSVHSTEEKLLFKKLMQEDKDFTGKNATPDWKNAVKIWNRKADGKNVFYKVNIQIIHGCVSY